MRDGAPWLQPCFVGVTQGGHNAADTAEEVGRAILLQSGAFLEEDPMPASRGLRMRESLGGDPAIISDLCIDDAGVVAIAAHTVRGLAPRVRARLLLLSKTSASRSTMRKNTTTRSTRRCGVAPSTVTSWIASASACRRSWRSLGLWRSLRW